jgi:hypothetical protein
MSKFDKLQKGHEYELRLLPDINDLKNPVYSVCCSFSYKKQYAPQLHQFHFCYHLKNDKLRVIGFHNTVYKYIQNCMKGFYGTSEGLYICDSYEVEKEPKSYWAYPDKTYPEINYEHDEKVMGGKIEFTDIQKYDPFLLVDVRSPYLLHIKTRTSEHMNLLDIYHIGLKETEPLYKEGDSKKAILDLFKIDYSLQQAAEDYMQGIIKHNMNHDNVEIVFGEESANHNWKARKEYYKKKYKECR